MKKFIFVTFTLLLFHSFTLTSYAQTAVPTPIYTCKKTCTTERICSQQATGINNGTCPRAEVCCESLYPPGVSPSPTPKITPLANNCAKSQVAGKEYHPLRPYPAAGCASHLIPIKTPEATASDNNLYLSYSCGKSANPEGTITAPDVVAITTLEKFPPLDSDLSSYINIANTNPNHRTDTLLCDDFSATNPYVCFLAKIVLNVTLNYENTTFPVIGNTKDLTLSDRNKLNNYLAWYLNGAVLQSEGKNLTMTKATDVDRLINFSGPVLKLLSQESLAAYRETLKSIAIIDNPDVHKYDTSSSRNITDTPFSSLEYTNMPIGLQLASTMFETASEEDVTGETQPGYFPDDQPAMPEIDGVIVSSSLSIGAADSRLYFPHLKNSVSLSEHLISTYQPLSEPPNLDPAVTSANLRQEVGQRFTLFQGFNDSIPVPVYKVWETGFATNSNVSVSYLNQHLYRNTEVFPHAPPPPPLFDNYAARFPGISNQKCDISPAVSRPGDTLFGSQINTTLTIYQVFKYAPQRIVLDYGLSSLCSGLGLNPTSVPTSCKNFTINAAANTGPNCSSLSGEQCDNDVPGSDGTCCWGKCPYLTECEKADANYYCMPGKSYDCGDGDEPKYLDCNSLSRHCCGPGPTTKIVDACVCKYPSDDIYVCDLDLCDGYTNAIDCANNIIDGIACKWGTKEISIPYTPTPVIPRCPIWPNRELKTKGRIAIFVKTPFVEKLYDLLVESPDSLMRRFLPYNAGKPAPSSSPPADYLKTGNKAQVGAGLAEYTVSTDPAGASLNNVKMTAGNGGAPALYYPKIGSLFNYLLGAGKDPLNLQCLLRPQGYCNSTTTAKTCLKTICDVAETYNIDCNFFKAIYAIETCNGTILPTGGSLGCCNSDGACGPMQLGGGTVQYISKDKNRNICMTECEGMDSFELAARWLLIKKWCNLNSAYCLSIPNPYDWNESYIKDYGDPNITTRSQVEAFILGWYGSIDTPEPRWGGKTYVDAVMEYLSSGSLWGDCPYTPPITDPNTGQSCTNSCPQ